MQPKFISSLAIAIAVGSIAGAASAQTVVVDDNVNQIEGTVSFSAGSVVPAPMNRLYVETNSIGISPSSSASTNANSTNPSSADYAVTVLADDIQHQVSPQAYSDGGRDRYLFASRTSPSVPVEPAPAVNLSFAECTGAVRIRFFENASGAGANVTTMKSNSRAENSPGSSVFGSLQASTSGSSTSSEIYPVRGDGLLHRIQVDFRTGIIPYSLFFERPVACGETVDIEIRLDEVPKFDLGGIKGTVDLRFRDENINTRMTAFSGPFSYSGSTIVAPGYGGFQILDLLPSSASSPARNYLLSGRMSYVNPFGTVVFGTPYSSVFVPEGQVVDVSNTFIINEAELRGQVELTGPQGALNRLSGAGSTIQASVGGSGGAASGGSATQKLSGAVSAINASTGDYRYNSAYELEFGTPNNVPANWQPRFYSYSLDPDNSSFRAYYSLYDNNVGRPMIAPGDVVDVPYEHCVVPVEAQVNINGSQNLGSSFNNPRVTINGSNSTKNYSVSGSATGSPASNEPPASTGKVTMVLPAGDYKFDTRISAYASTGEVSDTQLLPENAPVECGAWIRPFYFDIEVEDVECPGGNLTELPFKMDTKALLGGGRPARAYAYVNGGPDSGGFEIEICGGSKTACPDSAQFVASFNVDTSGLAQCGNSLEVFVLSNSDDLSKSAKQAFNFEQQGPTGWGCDDVELQLGSGETTASLDIFAVSQQLNECGLGQTEDTVCVVYDSVGAQTVLMNVSEGDTLDLPAGTHTGQCYVSTGCGNRNCSFDATVTN